MKKLTIHSAAAIAALIALAGCATGIGSSPLPGMNHGTSGASTTAGGHGPADGGRHNSADTMFAQMMIPHHAQAVDMSDTMLAKTALDPRITALAKDIKAAQGPEITKMTTWLAGWGEPAAMAGNHAMDGMMTADDLGKLTAAQGIEASKLFLAQMVAHHEGAVKMARTEVTGGKNAHAVDLAKDIIAAQESEIKSMKDLLATL